LMWSEVLVELRRCVHVIAEQDLLLCHR
jgi:hypothetical protein